MSFEDLKIPYGKIFVISISFLLGILVLLFIIHISTPNEIRLRDGKAYVRSSLFESKSFSVVNGEIKFYGDLFINPDQAKIREFSYGEMGRELFRTGKDEISSTFEFSIEMDEDRDDLVLGMYANPFEELIIWVNGKKVCHLPKKGFDPFEINEISTENKSVVVLINVKAKSEYFPEYLGKLIFMAGKHDYFEMSYVRDSKDMILIGGVFFLGIYYLIFYHRIKHKKLLMFALISISGAVRIFFSSTAVKNCSVFSIGSDTYAFVLCLLTAIPLAAFLVYLSDICENRVFKKLLFFSILLLAASCLFRIPGVFDWWGKKYETAVYFFVLMISLVGMTGVYLKGYSQGRVLVLGGCFSIVLITADILIKNFHIMAEPDIDLTGIGLMSFMLGLAVATSTELAKSYMVSEKLAEENMQMSTELKLIDRRLERRISSQTEFLMKIIGGLESDKKMLEEEVCEMKSQINEHKAAREEITVAYEKIATLPFMDHLTGICNRRGFLRWITMNHLGKNFRPFCIAIGDIDDFKRINDSFGHNFGDEVLVNISRILNSQVDKNSCVARWGGEEFIMAMPFQEETVFKQKMESIRERIYGEEYRAGNQNVRLTMTFGIACVEKAMNLEDIVEIVDKLLYAGKKTGKNKIII